MKTFTNLLIGLLLLCTYAVQAQTTISSNITTNTTWTQANSPYIVTSNIQVATNVTLTIESGVEVKFNSSRNLNVIGTLIAENATFTGNDGVTPGFWDGIYVSNTTTPAGNVSLTNCNVEYAGNIYVRNGVLNLTGTTLKNFSQMGVQIFANGTLNLSNSTIKNTNYPIQFTGAGTFNPTGMNEFVDNTNNLAYINFSTLSSEFQLNKTEIPYYLNNTFTISNTGEFIINPGVEVALYHSGEIRVDGKFKAIGTASDSIIFRKLSSANYSGGIVFRTNSIDEECIMQYCEIRNNANANYSSVALTVQNSSPTIENFTFRNNAQNVNITGDSKPQFTNCTFGASIRTNAETNNINMDLNAQPTFTNCDIAFNETELRAIGIMASTVTVNNTLKKINFNGIENITYCMYDVTTIAETAGIVVEPGVVIKSRNTNTSLVANGTLNGTGTASEPIVFTALSDDNFGNPADTQNNGTTTTAYSNWGRIHLNSVNESKLEKWKIHYSGYSSSYWAVYVTKNNIVNECEISYSSNGIRFTENAVITNNDFENITNYPISIIADNGNPTIHGNTLSNVGFSGIHIDAFANESFTLKKMNFAGKNNVPYINDRNLTITTGNNVTIEPGVVIKSYSYSRSITVQGSLQAVGTASEKIIFTSVRDDSFGGDTNNDGTTTIPGTNDWNGISFENSNGSTASILKYCDFYYAGWNNGTGVLHLNNSFVEIDNIQINLASTNGIAVFGSSNPSISNTNFINLNGAPIYMDMFSEPEFLTGNTMSNISFRALKVRGGTLSGTIPIRNFAGIDSVTYQTDENFTVNMNSELIFPAGVVFKGRSQWTINGKLTIQGTSANPVVFTTNEDDTHGFPADMQANGNTNPTNNGPRFIFTANSDNTSTIQYAHFRYSANTPIALTNASPSISNSTFQNLNYPGISLSGTSAPNIIGNTFDNVQFPFTTSLVTYPASTSGNMLTGTTARAIRITNETLNQNVTLAKRNFAGITNIPYVFGTYTIGTNAKLTIEPGVVSKFLSGGQLTVHNGLIAIGGNEPENKIVFTADNDDFYGGDTYNNGNANSPDQYHWYGISFTNTSIADDCIIKNAVIKHAGYYWSGAFGGVVLNTASPTIENVKFIKNMKGIVSQNASMPTIKNCDFSEVPSNGFAIENTTISNLVTAENCWFGNNTGPTHTSNAGGTGARVSDGVAFSPFLANQNITELGDVSQNSIINPYDASLILQHAVSAITLTPAQQNVADVSLNGAISSYDASLILQFNVGLLTTFVLPPVGTPQGTPLKVQQGATAQMEFGYIQTGAEKTIRIPLYLSTLQGVKSMDIRLDYDPKHIVFKTIDAEGISNNSTIASLSRDGKIFISMASAYDLSLDNHPVYLVFDTSENQTKSSDISLEFALANETELNTDDIQITVPANVISGMSSVSASSIVNVWSKDGQIMLEAHLSEPIPTLNIAVNDISGRMITTHRYENLSAGKNSLQVALQTGKISNGIYVVTIQGSGINESVKLIVR